MEPGLGAWIPGPWPGAVQMATSTQPWGPDCRLTSCAPRGNMLSEALTLHLKTQTTPLAPRLWPDEESGGKAHGT